MGEIADMIIDGECCALCMMPFEDDLGYPAVCAECWEEGCGYEKAPVDTLGGDEDND